jgi:hypothetical protein
MELNRITLILLGLVLLFGCVKPVQFEQSAFQNLLNVNVDSLGNGIYRVNFSKQVSTWDTANLNRVVVYNVFRRQVGGDSRDPGTVIARTFGRTSLLAQDSFYTYMDERGKIESIRCTNADQAIDTISDRTSQTYSYGVAAVTGLQTDVQGADFSGGFVNATTYAAQIFASKQPLFMMIKNGAATTPTRNVEVTGRVDTAGMDTLYYYRYSAIIPMDTLSTWLIRIADSAKKAGLFLNKKSGTTYAEYLAVNADSTVTLKVKKVTSTGDSIINYFSYGKIGKIDIIPKTGLAAWFDSFTVDRQGLATFMKRDILVSGPGKKWVMLRAVSKSNAKLWSPIADDIDITPSSDAGISVDLPDNSGGLPFVFNTFGDTTYSDTVTIWLATRNLTAYFMDGNGAITEALDKDTAYYPASKKGFLDAVLETPPQTFRINSYGLAAEKLPVDYYGGFRVSPLACKNDLGAVVLNIGSINRSNSDPTGLALSVTPGSIFGYHASRLNSFLPSTEIGRDTIYTYIGSRSAVPSPGWHTVGSAGKNGNISVEYFLSYDSVLYLNPLPYLPINVPSVIAGFKEFVLIAYTTGKYFGEPRVFISRFSSNTINVWDKVPPHITWSIVNDPFTPGGVYAPTVSTNLSVVNKVFDVYLDPDSKDDQIMAGIRDVGFGRIKSATLHFHYIDNTKSRGIQYTADSLTGERTYFDGSEDKEYALDAEQLQGQNFSAFLKISGALTRKSYSISRAAFKGIDARQWQTGFWDMWVVTEDDMGNKGVAPYGGMKMDLASGAYISRQIEIK